MRRLTTAHDRRSKPDIHMCNLRHAKQRYILVCASLAISDNYLGVDIRFEPVITTSKPDAFPSALRNKHSNVQQLSEDDVQKEAVIEQACEKCGNPEMRYYTLQLRSADEGTTVFYRCPKCNYRYASSYYLPFPFFCDCCRYVLISNSYNTNN